MGDRALNDPFERKEDNEDNPRQDFWGEHFRLDEAVIQPSTDIGEVTARIFEFNNDKRLVERQALIAVGRYPSAAALRRMTK